MTLEPLKSALTFGEIGETSLALPSDGNSRTGERRVMEQVSTMRKKSKSKYNNRGSVGTLSPTSPKSDSALYEYKVPSTNHNGSDFVFESTLANGNAKLKKHGQSVMQRSVSTKSAYSRINKMLPDNLPFLSQSSGYTDISATQGGIKSNTTNRNPNFRQTRRLVRSLSQPPVINFGPPVQNISFIGNSNQTFGSNTILRGPPSAHSNYEFKPSMSVKKPEMNGMNGEANTSGTNLSEAVYLLKSGDERYQLQGASVIQHSAFSNDKTKEEVRRLDGIIPLVSMLSNRNPQIQLQAASALRNLVFKNSVNKEQVLHKGGLTKAVDILKQTSHNTDLVSSEIQKHVTGLLWNLSSEERIQSPLLDQVLPVLNSTVLEPNVENICKGDSPRYESLCNATACLRNLSSGKVANRQALRSCPGLIDSLINHLEYSVENSGHDEKSVENCVCVLHNLTYQLETEVPTVFSKFNTLASENRANTGDTGPIGCFSNQSRKLQQEMNCSYPLLEDSDSKGKNRLIHPKTLQTYLNLLNNSQNTRTQEACCGALHNLTAKKGYVSDILSSTIVQKYNGMQNATQLLASPDESLKSSLIGLMGNLSRTPGVQRTLARQALPGLCQSLIVNPTPESDGSLAVACHTINNLMRAEPEMGKFLVNPVMTAAVKNLSGNTYMPKASTAAGALLHSLWSEKTIQTALKKKNMPKAYFVNDVTSAAIKSLQIVD
ncbi:plakophilin-1 [Clarias gariepinus]